MHLQMLKWRPGITHNEGLRGWPDSFATGGQGEPYWYRLGTRSLLNCIWETTDMGKSDWLCSILETDHWDLLLSHLELF